MVALLPNITPELKIAIVALIFGVVKVLVGAQTAKLLHDDELEYRAQQAAKNDPH